MRVITSIHWRYRDRIRDGAILLSVRRRILRRRIERFVSDISGVTGIEYGLIIAGISISIIATVFAIGEELNTMFEASRQALEDRGQLLS